MSRSTNYPVTYLERSNKTTKLLNAKQPVSCPKFEPTASKVQVYNSTPMVNLYLRSSEAFATLTVGTQKPTVSKAESEKRNKVKRCLKCTTIPNILKVEWQLRDKRGPVTRMFLYVLSSLLIPRSKLFWTTYEYRKFEVNTALFTMSSITWIVMPCSLPL